MISRRLPFDPTHKFSRRALFLLARPEGFEPPTPWFVARYSIQLSYGRILVMYGAMYGGEGGIRTLDGAINPILP